MRIAPTLLLLVGLSLAAPAAAQDAVWNKTRVLAAPEAVQAAVADKRFVYAIDNTRIAKYDRETGERLAISTGEAKHLNSGFFWEGRIYCAHSNYPRKPEQSEIKVLDPQTMELATFHDFGAYGGSLTWAVRRGGIWWCNFARYGAVNAETFLVEFDEKNWKELGRWTYPPEVIRELGSYSVSGGLWRAGELLVTGHDQRVLYRLSTRLQFNVPKFLEKQRIPFTGQGIADDPLTGGLVGIDRGKRQIVFASPAPIQRPLVVAHRGLSRHAPENTLSAFRACLDLRFGFEFDVRRSRDGHLVCVHDETLGRTTNGQGNVADHTLEELKQLDAGSWFDAGFRGERIPTVEEIVALVGQYRSHLVPICVDLKTTDEAVERDVVDLAREHQVLDRMLFIGRAIEDAGVRRRLREASPKALVAALANTPSEFAAALSDRDSNWVYLRFIPSREDVARIRETNKHIFIAGPVVAGMETANWQAAEDARVGAILTDYPLELRRMLREPD